MVTSNTTATNGSIARNTATTYRRPTHTCDYDLFANVKEPLRETRYNTRDELIRAIGRSNRNINKDRRANNVHLAKGDK